MSLNLPTIKPGDLCERYALDQVKCDNQGTHMFDATIVPGFVGGKIILCDGHTDLEKTFTDFKGEFDALPR